MTQEEMQNKFVDIVMNIMGTDDLTSLEWQPEDYRIKLDDVMDSLDRVEFVMELEEDFDIHIPDWAAKEWVTIQDVYNLLTQKVAANATG